MTLGLSPAQLNEYTDNDILELLYYRKEQSNQKILSLKRLAWFISNAIGNIFSKYPKSFSELWAENPPQTNDEIADNCRLKGHKVPHME